MFGLGQGSGVSKANFSTLVNGYVGLGLPEQLGDTDKVEIKGDVNLSVIAAGLGTDTVGVRGALQGVLVLLDGLCGLVGKVVMAMTSWKSGLFQSRCRALRGWR